MRDEKEIEIQEKIPLLPLRDMVVFPHMVVPLFVGRAKSIKALEGATLDKRLIFLATQKKASIDEPTPKDLYQTGLVAEILQLLKLPDGTIKVLIEGLGRAKVKQYLEESSFFYVKIEVIDESFQHDIEVEALMRTIIRQFEEYIKLKKLPHEIIRTVATIEEPGRLADTIAAHLNLKVPLKQEILEIVNPRERLKRLAPILYTEIEILGIESRIEERVKQQIEKSQKEYYLGEKLKAIQRELGQEDEREAEFQDLKEKIKEAEMPPEAEEKAVKELERLKKMPPMATESSVIRTYLDWMISLPWNKLTKDKLNIQKAEQILEKTHYGVREVKERVLEYLAVRKLAKKEKGSILCFVGPPGTGKTSIARSIAEALGRKFIRLSLGGIRDEAEIRGHRVTYVAAMPGRIIQSIRRAGTRNPVFLLDEVDKMSVEFRGDPSAALLELLDPAQNSAFSDNYLGVPFDLSDVIFITTANSLHLIPPPLRDRMEVLNFPSYLEQEKLKIAELFLIPKQLREHGLSKKNLSFSRKAIINIIRHYTREAGVRNLEREIAKVSRKVAREVVRKREEVRVKITCQNLEKYLGLKKYKVGAKEEESKVGIATGLAWTEMGGDILTIEAVTMPGKGVLTLTGKLGEVMKESAHAALSFARSRAKILRIDPTFYEKIDIHIHIPEGGIPKDGPSAGITIGTALISALTNRAIPCNIAMTGEITLRGRVLPIGGVKEKVIAAHRAGISKIILPFENKKDLADVPREIKGELEFVFVEKMDEVLKEALRL